jgi:UDP-N-acetylglucosamine 2-epimerase (non-hydrolysing)
MPEEINRMVTDVLADILWTPTREAGENLIREGVSPEKVQFVGNIMIDSLEMMRVKIESQRIYSDFGLKVRGYGVITFHRPSNVDSPAALKKMCEQLWKISETIPLIFPIHPRTRANLQKHDLLSGLEKPDCFLLPEPQSYVRFMNLVANCLFVITDSGGIQEETTHLGIPCLTVRDNTERPVTVTHGTNRLCKLDDLIPETERILNGHTRKHKTIELWDGKTAERIVMSLKNTFL